MLRSLFWFIIAISLFTSVSVYHTTRNSSESNHMSNTVVKDLLQKDHGNGAFADLSSANEFYDVMQ